MVQFTCSYQNSLSISRSSYLSKNARRNCENNIMPIPLLVIFYSIISVVAKLVTGAATAGLVYYFLINTVQPILDRLTLDITQKVSEFSTIGGTSLQVIQYLDFPHSISILLATSSACFSIKIMSIAIRAFGINTGS